MRPTETGAVGSAIDAQLQIEPEMPCLVFIQGDGQAREITKHELRRAIHANARALQAQGIGSGDVVALALEHTWELAPAFLGAMHIGAIPAFLPYLSTISGHMLDKQIQGIVTAWGIRSVVTLQRYRSQLGFLASAGWPLVELPTTAEESEPSVPVSMRSGDEIAHLQLSSGTTSQPKAVMVSHRTLLNGIAGIMAGLPLAPQDVSVGWLPLHHDLGLIFQLLMPLVGGMLSVLIAPEYWVRRPRSLMQAVHRYRGTYTGMPNFAFNHCARNIRDSELAGIDLSSWRLVLNGAEIVRHESMETFYTRFAPYGLQHEALRTIYGMTENGCTITLTRPVAANEPWRADWVSKRDLVEIGVARVSSPGEADVSTVVSCGHPLPQTELRIIDEAGAPLPDRRVGEILLRTPYLNPGYFRRADLTIADADGWFATGDLGYLVDGELFICGRKKDLIITGGRHVLPTIIEIAAATILGERAGDMAAFGVASAALGTELPVLVCEVRGKFDEDETAAWAARIRQQVRAEMNLALADIRFVRRGWLVQTTSAKIIRTACRRKYLAEFAPEGLDSVDMPVLLKSPRPELPNSFTPPRIPLEEQIAAIWADLLGLDEVGVEDNFFNLGGDSLSALRMLLAVEETTGHPVPVEFFQQPTIACLVGLLAADAAPASLALPRRQRWPAERSHSIRRRSPLVRHGPLLRRHALPHGLGVRLQRAWLTLPGVQRVFFDVEIALLRRWGERIGVCPSPQVVLESLLANSWEHWRTHALANSLGTSPWVTVEGDLATWQPGGKDSGVIFLVMHSTLTALFARKCTAGGMRALFVGGATGETESGDQDRAIQVYKAHQALNRREPVIIAGDGGKGKHGVTVPFFGGERRFYQGGAELAVQTGARLVPVFGTINAKGGVAFEICPPLERSGGSVQAQVERLTRAYAELVVARWPQVHHCLAWGNLARRLDMLEKGQA